MQNEKNFIYDVYTTKEKANQIAITHRDTCNELAEYYAGVRDACNCILRFYGRVVAGKDTINVFFDWLCCDAQKSYDESLKVRDSDDIAYFCGFGDTELDYTYVVEDLFDF